jgi:hypothetical protein
MTERSKRPTFCELGDIEFGDANLSGPCSGYAADFLLKLWTP